ncbi:hypothetical protein [Paraburkholderia fynbosensis]|uniref:hypothetical protein n=1 Tax=Paraburkholderia fynbosensis TaxID=1200993 RepID=UPI001FE565AC|nr:hypothetical protein [Paraburkholderia fynbosensis]
MTILEGAFTRRALTEEEKRVRIAGCSQPQVESRIAPRRAVVRCLGNRHREGKLGQTGETAIDVDSRNGRDRIDALLRRLLATRLVESRDAQGVTRRRAESAG